MRKQVYYKKFLKVWKQKYNHALKKGFLDQLRARFITEHVKRKLFRVWLKKMRE